MTTIPYNDIPRQHAPIKAELLEAIGRVIDHGIFILGPEVAKFEEEFARLCGVKYAVGVNSGTDALVFALRALGIGPGDEVITVPNSFIASTTCIRMAGAKPVFVDAGADYNIDPRLIEAAITPRTKAILPVHLTGRPADMDAVMEIATRHRIHVVEDCAQSVLAAHNGRMVGSFGEIGCFSLHPLKTLNACGDGGMLTTSDPALFEQLKIMRNIGLKTRDDCVMWSPNSRLDTLQAAVLLVKLRYLEEWTRKRRANADVYRRELRDVPQIVIPADRPNDVAVYHTFVVQADRRDELREFLTSRGIATAIHYPVPIHLSSVGRELGHSEGSFPVAERQASRIVSLPVYPEMGEAAIGEVCQAIRNFYKLESNV
jgi:dTDP-4-amino-4,6-dideoxygalactose transaminase